MSTEAAIQRGRGLISNPAFFMIFAIAAAMGIAGMMTIGISHTWGWVLTAVTAALFGIAWVSGLGEKLFVGIIALGGLASGFMSVIVVWMLWGQMHEQYLWGSLLALVLVTLPVAAIAGERVLPLFVALIAGAWGIASVIVFIMAVSGLGMGTH